VSSGGVICGASCIAMNSVSALTCPSVISFVRPSESVWFVLRITNLWVGSSKPSTFSSTAAAFSRSLVSSWERFGSRSKMNNGSFGFEACSAVKNGTSTVVLLAIG